MSSPLQCSHIARVMSEKTGTILTDTMTVRTCPAEHRCFVANVQTKAGVGGFAMDCKKSMNKK